jgi:hypothetical protein
MKWLASLLFLLTFCSIVKADSVPSCRLCPVPVQGPGSEWSILFSVNYGPETFIGDLTVQYEYLYGELTQFYSGTITPYGPVDFLPATYNNFVPQEIDGDYLGVYGPRPPNFGDEVDFYTANPVQSSLVPPFVQGPSLYSCVSQGCLNAYNGGQPEEYRSVYIGPFVPITNEIITELPVNTPEPSGLLLLTVGLAVGITASAKRRWLRRSFCSTNRA